MCLMKEILFSMKQTLILGRNKVFICEVNVLFDVIGRTVLPLGSNQPTGRQEYMLIEDTV